jgi:hypothetical protein
MFDDDHTLYLMLNFDQTSKRVFFNVKNIFVSYKPRSQSPLE